VRQAWEPHGLPENDLMNCAIFPGTSVILFRVWSNGGMPDMAISKSSLFSPDRNLSRELSAEGNPFSFGSADVSCAVNSFSGCLVGRVRSVHTNWLWLAWKRWLTAGTTPESPISDRHTMILRISRPLLFKVVCRLIGLECIICHFREIQGMQATLKGRRARSEGRTCLSSS
jgi:hypothetical protein